MTRLNIFLSASVPRADRDEKFFRNLDVIAIRDAVKSLAMLVPYKYNLVWGGHPSITPIIVDTLSFFNCNVDDYITLYQSKYYPQNSRPKENEKIGKIIETEIGYNKLGVPDRDESLKIMRKEMIEKRAYCAAIFIGGMEGIFDEYKIFIDKHPKAKVIPVPTTGGAAKILYDDNKDAFDERLEDNYAYLSLFKQLLNEKG